jgi:hypothetical protein
MAADRHGDIDVIGDHNAALAANQRSRLRKIEDRTIAEGPDQGVLVGRADRLAGILDQDQLMPIGDLAEFRPRRGMSIYIAGDDRLRLLGNLPFRLLGHQRPRPIVNIGEYRERPSNGDRVGNFSE